MTITLNGQPHPLTAPTTTIADLLQSLGLEGKPVVVEHNLQALLPRELQATPVADGDSIEIVQITAGG
jgi:sulfur carrier protein